MISKCRQLALNQLIALFVFGLLAFEIDAAEVPSSDRSLQALSEVESQLKRELTEKGLTFGAPVFIRIFKEPALLEVWIESDSGDFVQFKSYDICDFSGELGPKLKEGDFQSPEGFYFVKPNQLNPWSRFYLSFNLGFPNQYDRFHKRSGSALMVHGNCASIGCYAMTDEYITEIYALASAALTAGQPFFRVHAFPFKLEEDTLNNYQSNRWYPFWLNLKEGYDYFINNKKPPNVEVVGGKYVFEAIDS